VYIRQDFIKPNAIEVRSYQINIARASEQKNALVVLPTGMGKTIIALLLIAKNLHQQGTKILFLAPTKPLVIQHAEFLRAYLTIDPDSITVFTGEISPAKRADLWEKSALIVSTPQVIQNDLLSKRINLEKVSFIIYDEAHHAVGDYAYVLVSEMYQRQRPKGHALGITASPGNDVEKIKEICHNLDINHIEIRTKYDPDVKPYVHELSLQWREVSLPTEFSQILQLLRRALAERLRILHDYGVLESPSVSLINRKRLLEVQQTIQLAIRETPQTSKHLYQAASKQSEAMKLHYALELLQTQGVHALRQFLQRIHAEASTKAGSKASKVLMKDPIVLETLAYVKTLQIEHPKFQELATIVRNEFQRDPHSKIIVFTHYRDTALQVKETLKEVQGCRPVRFIGQSGKLNDKGLTQKQQAEIVHHFKDGTHNVLIATSVAEEGLDIPSTELVVFFEPIPSEIRTIQRRGRTARKMAGRVIILITKGTPDEGYYWASKRREKRMHTELELLRSQLSTDFHKPQKPVQTNEQQRQKTLKDFNHGEHSLTIKVDHREYRSPVVHHLASKGMIVEPLQLDIGDYVLSTRIGVERKTVDDFLDSLIDGKLFRQLQHLRDSYARPILVVEGEDLFTKRNISHHSIYGSFISILVDFGIPIISTKSARDTADLLYIAAKREQRQEKKTVALRGEKPSPSQRQRQQYIIEGLPNVSSVLAQRLLDHFGSIRALMNATEKELMQVQGVGKAIAQGIIEIINGDASVS
jgi:ERCC4-related helicase